MSERNALLLIDDMLDSATKILSYCKGLNFDQFIENQMLVDAIVRNFEIIGEAATRVPDTFKEQYQHIPWARLKGFRNRLIHEYFGIDYAIVWDIIEYELAALVDMLTNLR